MKVVEGRGREGARAGGARSELACTDVDVASPSPGRPGERTGEAGGERVRESGRSVGEQYVREQGVERCLRSPRTPSLYLNRKRIYTSYGVLSLLKIHLPETPKEIHFVNKL